jgi:hypothetical protein
MDNDDIITIKTSCGRTFHQRPSEMSERQLRGLIEQNADNTDEDCVRDMPRLRAELARRFTK